MWYSLVEDPVFSTVFAQTTDVNDKLADHHITKSKSIHAIFSPVKTVIE